MNRRENNDQDLFGLFKKPEMDPLGKIAGDYLRELKRRNAESRAYKSYQLTGLEIANILEDWEHKSLYMRLAKERGEAKMVQLAKNVVERKNVDNKGAYFMRILKNEQDRNDRK